MIPIDLSEKVALVLGVANKNSIAWSIAQKLSLAGAKLVLTYQNERLEEKVKKLAQDLEDVLFLPCDVSDDEQIKSLFSEVKRKHGKLNVLVHSLAYASKEDLEGAYVDTSREGFTSAVNISAYSLIALVKHALPLMEKEGGTVMAMTFLGSERIFPVYNVMGSAKAALEHVIKNLASELGEKNIRINGISAGPLNTLAARGIPRFLEMLHNHEERSPMRRNITQEEVADCALFLSSDLSTGISGEVIHVDAGYHIVGL
jgi:enoyl-[acyl-carrier protein] reductase I